jgi:pilus assembly protein CpaF
MFGKRPGGGAEVAARPKAPPMASPKAGAAAPPPATRGAPPPHIAPPIVVDSRSEQYYEIKTTIFNALIDTIDLAQLAQLDAESAREEIRDIVNEIIAIKNVTMSIA